MTVDKVREIMYGVLDGLELWDFKGEEAEKQLAYIGGVRDMTGAVICAIKANGGDSP